MADQTVVLEHGTVSERGAHEDLLERGCRYAQMFRVQTQGYLEGCAPSGSLPG